ncbi:Afadin and alpha-actinin-binding-domain-containing protein [Multifurca ochricompacta]|uniref:Afadin and alpha-actinin-binding-domain-containing protein n=1 Tax=Multifurca ochricompacta TaxID=376703 RepID=A0AAD4QF87_9AGAM|nr:Afadin and alpha-actinin-binding-domain-containing protein [Multifurca ochricompacta]
MASTPAPNNVVHVHWALSPLSQSDTSSSTSTSAASVSSTSTLQYINAQLISHGFTIHPGLSLDGLSSAEAESVVKCLLSMLGQRVEDMTRAEELTTKLRTLSYDHERLRSMHDSEKETAEVAEREVAAAKAKLTTANRTQQQAEAAHKQTISDLQRTRSSLQALRATHVAELKKRDKEIEAMRERWSKLSDSQLKMGNVPSGMTIQPANALALDGGTLQKGKGLVDTALEGAEKACVQLRDENAELKGLIVDTANAVRKILHKAVSPDPDDLEFPPPMATIDFFPLGSPDTAFERLSALLTTLRDALTTLRASATPIVPGSEMKPQISLADLEKKAAESEAKAHKWEIEELKTTIAGLRDELRKVKAEKKPAPATQMQTIPIPTVHDDLLSCLPPQTDELETGTGSQSHIVGINPEPDKSEVESDFKQDERSAKKVELLSTAPAPAPTKHAPVPVPVPQAGPSRLSPRKTRSKSKGKLAHKSPLKAVRASASSAKRSSTTSSRPKRLSTKRVEAPFETEVIPSTVPTSLLPTSFVLPPPSPQSRLPPHPASLSAPSAPLSFPSTTPPFPPPAPAPKASSSTSLAPSFTPTEKESQVAVVPDAGAQLESQIPLTPKLFPVAKPMVRNMAHAYSPAKPSPLSRILMLADSPEGMTLTETVAHTHVPTFAPGPTLALPPFSSQPVMPVPIPIPAFTTTVLNHHQ